MRFVRNLLRSLPLVGVLIIALIVPLRMAVGMAQPQPGAPVVVIAAPWASAIPLATHAGGRLIADGRVRAVAMVWSDNPNFTAALYAEGAWLVLDGDMVGFLCDPQTGEQL